MCKCEFMKVPKVERVLLKHRTKAGTRERQEIRVRKVGRAQAVEGPL